MNKTSFLGAAAICVALSPLSAAAATYSFTEGNGDNRPFVDGSIDLEDAPKNALGFELNSETGQAAFGADDELLIFGRIVGSQDLFSYTFAFESDFTVGFNFGSYFVDNVEVTDTGLVAQSEKGGGPTPGVLDNAGDYKGVSFGLKNNDDNSIVSALFDTDVLSVADMGIGFDSPVFFNGLGGISYTLIVDGSVGPNKGAAALYDLRIAGVDPTPAPESEPDPVPVPASVLFLGTALASMGVIVRRRRRTPKA